MSASHANRVRGRANWILRGAGMVVVAAMVWLLGSAIPHANPELRGLTLTPVASGLIEPVAAAPQPGTSRVFVVERVGRVRVFENWVLVDEPAVDLTARVSNASWEQGLLGLALHPDYGTNGRVFISYTDVVSGDQVVSEFQAHEPGGARFDPSSEIEMLRVSQRGPFHQGGTIRFGPDGFLWIGFGDGGTTVEEDAPLVQDPLGHGQNPYTLQGTMVRIDVDTGDAYGIPADNPFAHGAGGAPEVWAYGLRNPWGFTFDNGRLFIADVGHVVWEEVDVVSLSDGAGSNFGWSMWDGPECFADRPCDTVEAIAPALAVPRPEICAIVGGPVYRGSAIPELDGRYLYADLCTGSLRAVTLSEGRAAVQEVLLDPAEAVPQVTALFTGVDGEVHALTLDGRVFRLDPIR